MLNRPNVLVIGLSFSICSLSSAMTVNELMTHLKKAEERRSEILAEDYSVVWIKPKVKLERAQLGSFARKPDKIRLERSQFAIDENDHSTVEFKQLFAYNGVCLKTLDTSDHAVQPSGYIGTLKSQIAGEYTPDTLFGNTILNTGAHTLSEALAESKIGEIVLEERDIASIHGAYRVDMTCPIPVVGSTTKTLSVPVSVWVAPKNDWNVVRIQTYGDSARNYVLNVLDNITFEESEGGLLPVAAVQSWYPSQTVLDSASLVPSKEPETRQKLTVGNWKVGDLPDSMFNIEYAVGTRVYDAITDHGYVVGESE